MTTRAYRSSLGIGNDIMVSLQVSQDGTANTAANPAVVPVGKIWLIRTASIAQSDVTARATAIQIVDPSGNVIRTLVGDTVTTAAVNTVKVWAGHCVLTAGFKIQGLTTGISASTPTIQFGGFEANTGLPLSVLGIN